MIKLKEKIIKVCALIFFAFIIVSETRPSLNLDRKVMSIFELVAVVISFCTGVVNLIRSCFQRDKPAILSSLFGCFGIVCMAAEFYLDNHRSGSRLMLVFFFSAFVFTLLAMRGALTRLNPTDRERFEPLILRQSKALHRWLS